MTKQGTCHTCPVGSVPNPTTKTYCLSNYQTYSMTHLIGVTETPDGDKIDVMGLKSEEAEEKSPVAVLVGGSVGLLIITAVTVSYIYKTLQLAKGNPIEINEVDE